MLKRRKLLAVFARSKSCPAINGIALSLSSSEHSFVNPYETVSPKCTEFNPSPKRKNDTIPSWAFKTTEHLLQEYGFKDYAPTKIRYTDHSQFKYDLVMNALVESLKIATTSLEYVNR